MLVDAAQIDPAASPDQTITPAPSPGIIRTRPHAILSDSETFFSTTPLTLTLTLQRGVVNSPRGINIMQGINNHAGN